MNEKREKEAFPRGEKSKNAENRLSQHWENKKSAKNDFPNIGKNKKCHWLHFPTLGKMKNPESQIKDFRVRFFLTHFLAGTTPQSMTADTFHASCMGIGLPCPGCHSGAYQECSVPIHGLFRID